MRTPAAWLRSVKRRKPGVYIYRTRRHHAPWRTEWGYAGKSLNLDIRDQCHGGTCGRHQGCIEKPWWDLKVSRFTLRLPWYLGWDWVILSVETALVAATRPRYNWQKNPSRHKIPPSMQRMQRQARDAMPTTYRARLYLSRFISFAISTVAVGMVAAGIGGYLWTR